MGCWSSIPSSNGGALFWVISCHSIPISRRSFPIEQQRKGGLNTCFAFPFLHLPAAGWLSHSGSCGQSQEGSSLSFFVRPSNKPEVEGGWSHTHRPCRGARDWKGRGEREEQHKGAMRQGLQLGLKYLKFPKIGNQENIILESIPTSNFSSQMIQPKIRLAHKSLAQINKCLLARPWGDTFKLGRIWPYRKDPGGM